MSWLEKIQNKSDREKTIIAFWTALIITLVLVSIWAFNLSYTLEGNKEQEQTASPISSISNRVKDIFSGGREVYQAE